MTEAEWLSITDPIRLLTYLNRPQNDRKLLLYGVACGRQYWRFLSEPASRLGIEQVEQFADGTATIDDEYYRLEWASEGAAFRAESHASSRHRNDWADQFDADDPQALRQLRGPTPPVKRDTGPQFRVDVAYFANHIMNLYHHSSSQCALKQYAHLLSLDHLRDIFSNPFRPVVFDPTWRTSTVVALAEAMYTSRRFDPMPVLADALQEAGCDDEQILTHCRGTDPHVRGCWVVDLVLGKS